MSMTRTSPVAIKKGPGKRAVFSRETFDLPYRFVDKHL